MCTSAWGSMWRTKRRSRGSRGSTLPMNTCSYQPGIIVWYTGLWRHEMAVTSTVGLGHISPW